MADRIKLGDIARDRVSGFEGVVVGRTQWLRGCDRLVLQSQALYEGKPVEPVSFDEPDLEFVRTTDLAEEHAAKPVTTGGPRPTPSRH